MEEKKRILILGASSYVGARIYWDLKDTYPVSGTYLNNRLTKVFHRLDLTANEDVIGLVSKLNPEVIIHAANYPSPSNASGNEEKFRLLNKTSTAYVVEAANKAGAKVVFISSLAAETKNNIYGELKAESEELIKLTNSGWLIIRPSFIVGLSPNTENNRPFNRFLKCLENRTEQGEFDTSWKLQPSYLGHLSQVINETIRMGGWNKVISVFIDEAVSQYQLASDVLGKFGVSVKEKDLHLNIPLSQAKLDAFKAFNLEPKIYKEMIDVVVEEIENRNRYLLE